MWDFLRNLFGAKKTLLAPPGYFISTSGQTQQRIDKLGLTTPSEDASHILSSSRLTFPPSTSYDREYKGNPDLAWLIDIFPPANGKFDKDRLWKIFDRDWRQSHPGFELYGHGTDDHLWTYVIAGNTPESYDQLQSGWPLVKRYIPEDRQEVMSVSTLTKFRKDLIEKLNKHFPGATLQDSEDIPTAIGKAEELAVIQKRFGRDSILILKSDSLYPGRLAWDALISVGLQWGDGDLFHWDADGK